MNVKEEFSKRDSSLNDFVLKLRLSEFSDEQEKAEAAVGLIESVLAEENLTSYRLLLDALHCIGTVIQSQTPSESTPYNMTQRIVKVVKDEYNMLRSPSSQNISSPLTQDRTNVSPETASDDDVDMAMLKANVLDVVAELKAELEQCQELISTQGESKIHSDEIILTCGFCPTVLGFFLKAAKKRRFHVIVAESAPKYDGHKMAKMLASANIQTTSIQDCAVFPMMSRVNKVILGCQTVFCNGGMKTLLGAAPVACAAKYYSVPLYVCAPTYKFSNELCEEVNEFGDPFSIIPRGKEDTIRDVNVAIAKFDYVPPESITSYITNNRGIAPSYVYRQVMDLYSPAADDI